MAARCYTAVLILLAALGPSPAAAPSGSTLFSSHDALAIGLKAPFNDLFDRGRTSDTYAVTGTLSYTDAGREIRVEGVKIFLRGNTSKQERECPFPKLKLQLPPGGAAGSMLDGITSLKVGTHCGEAADESLTAKYGRLPNEQSPLREAFVYRLLEAIGVPTLKARPARVTYVYTDARPGETPPQAEPLVRNALIIENTEDAVKRFGGAREIDEKGFSHARAQFTPADTARVAFAEALIGNFDWCLKMTANDAFRCNARHPLWNIVAAASGDGKARPLMYDFDVSGMVAGRHAWFKNHFSEAFVASRSQAEVEVLAQVQRTRSLFTRAELDAARAEFMSHKADAYRTLDAAKMDDAGRARAKEYLDSFYAAIGSDEAFYRPVVVKAGTKLYANEQSAVVCASRGAVPIGTPASEPVQTKGSLIQVHLLDVHWHWAPPVKCAAVREGPVWIDADAISKDYPPAAK